MMQTKTVSDSTTSKPLQIVQDEMDRYAAKYNLKAYVLHPSEHNKGNVWGKKSICQVVINDEAAMPVSHEWAAYCNVDHLRMMMDEAFRVVSKKHCSRQLHNLVMRSRRR